ncbi:hypothetical protein NQZ68_039700, partial [Dissostichus eleginoides]
MFRKQPQCPEVLLPQQNQLYRRSLLHKPLLYHFYQPLRAPPLLRLPCGPLSRGSHPNGRPSPPILQPYSEDNAM